MWNYLPHSNQSVGRRAGLNDHISALDKVRPFLPAAKRERMRFYNIRNAITLTR